MTARRWLLVAIASVALFLVLGRILAGVYAEWTWYAAMDALPVYRSKLLHLALLRGGALVAGFALAFGNLYGVRRSIVSLVLPRRLANLEIGEAIEGRLLNALVVALSLVIAVLVALPQDDWLSVALARFGEPFGERDGYVDRDFGFYVYHLPFERSLYLWAVVALLVVCAVVVFLYAVTPSLKWERGRLHISTYVRRHFAVLSALAMLLVSWSYRLESLSLLSAGSGSGGAFSAFDHGIAMPLVSGLAIGTFLASFVLFWAGWHGYRRVTLGVLTVILIAGPVSRSILPLLDRWATTEAERQARERPYLSTRTQFTRRAFGVDQVVDAGAAKVTPLRRDEVADGVSNWDALALERTTEMEHRGRTAITLGWIPAARGMSAAIVQRPPDGGTTHVVSRLDGTTADERGRALPVIALPPALSEGTLTTVMVEPGATSYALVADSMRDLAAPSFSTWTERILHAWHLQNPRLLAVDPPLPRPRLVLHRDVRERIEAVAPFFTVGPTLQAVVNGDSLYWVAELFATSTEYPLSDAMLFAGATLHYVRHAGSAVVQAQTGRVSIIADRATDPITRTWMKRFPWLFVSRTKLPAGLEALLPPAADWAALQAAAIVHSGFPGDTILARQIAWSFDRNTDLRPVVPALFASHGTRGPLSLSIGMLDSDEHIIGAVVARGGETPRTEWHRISRTVRWRQLLDQLVAAAHDGTPARLRGTERVGRAQVIPTNGGVLVAQSFYEWPPDGPPSLSRVAVFDGERVRAGRTLADALGLAQGVRALNIPGTAAFRARVVALYEEMSAAMRRGDWKAFGEAYAALGRLLQAAP